MHDQKLGTTVKHAANRVIALMALFAASMATHAAEPLKIAYNDWPGAVAWQVAIDKGWFKEAGVDVDFEWFDYSAALDAFAAGKLDAVGVTNGDLLATGASGTKSVMIMLTDYSSGNDMVVAKPGIKGLKDLKGKKIAVEKGLVDHLLLLDGLKKAGMTESDVTLVNAKTNELPQILASSDISAIGVWAPVSGQAMQRVPGSRPIFTSANEPGLIYDGVAVSPTSLAAHKADWVKVVKVWNHVVSYINDPATQPDAVKIMAARVNLTPEAFLPLLKGTHLLNLSDNRKIFVKGEGFGSLYGSSKVADDFNVSNAIYPKSQDVDRYFDASYINAR
ncbi:ABC transporter substrate-binding protein [Paraburkholderia pallida]|uniref:Transporter substrate-binding domain-containing protein n=1 Tax=Paraburkholderia pallida TaxID=2547399 RepID=A0A4P7D3H0_9BURK|nr:transporter substrate-binding domain-containing protein [Paraburkholderia pallida]